MINEKDPKHQKTKHFLKTTGLLCLIPGLLCILIGLVTFPEGFWLFFCGMPLSFVGGSMTMFGFQAEVIRYQANETAPVAKDTINYMVDGTKESIKTVVSSISEGINHNSVKCSSCNAVNNFDAVFCNKCGKPIIKICSQCQNKNAFDAVFCNKCGTKINS